MGKLNTKQVNQLLKLIKHPEDKKIVKKFLLDIDNSASVKLKDNQAEHSKKSTAKKALDIISRIGLEIFKHKAIDALFDLFD